MNKFQFLCSDSKINEVYSTNNEGGVSYFFQTKKGSIQQ